MDLLGWRSEVSHKIVLNEAFARSPQYAVLISYFLKHWMFSRQASDESSDPVPFDNMLIKLCEEKKRGDINTLKTCFAQIEQMAFSDILSTIDLLCGYDVYFTFLGIFKKTMRSSAIINYLSKSLNIIIIQVERGSEVPKEFFSGFGQNPIVIHIVQDGFKYYPGIHLEEYRFIQNPKTHLLKSFPFILSDDRKPRPRTLQEKITTIMKNLEKSLDHVYPEMGDQLSKFIAQHPFPGIKDEDLNSFKNALKNTGKCINHSLAVFDCDNIHCHTCAYGKTSCRCEKRFDYQRVSKKIIDNKIKTTFLVTTTQISGTNPNGTNRYNLPNINNPPSTFTVSSNPVSIAAPNNPPNIYTQNPPISVQNSHTQSYSNMPIQQVNPPVNLPSGGTIQNIYPKQNLNYNQDYQQPIVSNDVVPPQPVNNPNLAEPQNISIYYCFGCQRPSDLFCVVCDDQTHIFCEICYQLSQSYCPMCRSIVCCYCNIFDFVSNMNQQEGYFFHPTCMNAASQNS